MVFAHMRRWPDRPISLTSCLWLLASSSGLQFLLVHRLTHWVNSKQALGGKYKWLRRIMKLSLIPILLVNKINAISDINSNSEIEGGVCFSDQGYIFFGALNTGAGTVINTRVTVGQSHVDGGLPVIGRNVWIGSDCVIYGAIRIGDGATLLPGTVLTKSIPAGIVVQGNPARLVLQNFDNSELRARKVIDAMRYIKIKKQEFEC
jgi:serine acetyltransferase